MNEGQARSLGRRSRILKWVAQLACRFAWPVIVLSVLGAVASLVLTGFWPGLGYISDTNELIRHDSEVHGYYLAYSKEFDVRPEMVVVVAGPKFERNRQAMDALAAEIVGSGRFERVRYRHDLGPLRDKFLLYSTEEQLAEIRGRLSELAAVLGDADRPLFHVTGMLEQANAMFDERFLRNEANWAQFVPFIEQFVALLHLMADQLEGEASAEGRAAVAQLLGEGSVKDIDRLLAQNEYFGFNEGRTLLMTVTPRSGDPDAISPFAGDIAWLRDVLERHRPTYPDLALGLTGEVVLDADQVATSMRGVTIASVLTMVLIGTLFLVSYGEWRRPGLALFVMVLATIWTFGFTVLAIGHLNIITSAFVAMILGLGIDFSIQVMGRYSEELKGGLPPDDAIVEAVANTGNAVLTGAGTTAAAFYSMCFNDFLGLSELGLISGTGIVLSAAASLILLPALFSVSDRKGQGVGRLGSGLLDRWVDALRHEARPRTVLGIAGLTTAAALYLGSKVEFDYNLLHLQNQDLESVRVAEMLFDRAANALVPGVILADSLEETRAKSKLLLQHSNTVQSVESLASLMPEGQEQKLPLAREIVAMAQRLESAAQGLAGPLDAEAVRVELETLLAQSREAESQARKFTALSDTARLAQDTFAQLIPALERALGAMRDLDSETIRTRLNRFDSEVFGEMRDGLALMRSQDVSGPVEVKDLPPDLLETFVGTSGKMAIFVFPREDVWDREPAGRFVASLRAVDPRATGTPVQNFEYLEELRTAYVEAGALAFGVICVALLFHFRRLSYVGLALVPLLLGMVWTVGAMPVFGLKFNPANIITLPLVIGIGVAFGIYALDRFREAPERSIFDTSTAKSVLLSGMTTLIAFASLILAEFEGISSLGQLMTLGVASCLVTSLGVLPAFLHRRLASR